MTLGKHKTQNKQALGVSLIYIEKKREEMIENTAHFKQKLEKGKSDLFEIFYYLLGFPHNKTI